MGTMLFKLWSAALLGLLLAGCASAPSDTGMITHVVVCWLKEPGNPDHRQKIIEASNSFKEIPGVRKVTVGEPLPSDRAMVDASFDVAVCVRFANADALNTYLRHPLHEKAGREILLPLTRKVVVYDFKQD